MENDIGKIKKNETTDIVVRIDDYGGKRGVTIREYVTSERYTGFTKSGTRISAESFLPFRELINSIAIADLQAEEGKEAEAKEAVTEEKEQKTLKDKEAKPKKGRKKKAEKEEIVEIQEEKKEDTEEVEDEEDF